MNLTPELLSKALRRSRWEGLAWALMVGVAETYFIADAVRLQASALQLALTVTLPLALAGAGPLLVLGLLRAGARRKPVAVSFVASQAALLLTMAALETAHLMSPAGLIALVCVYQVAGQAAGTAWSSWMGDLVPGEIRGRFFGGRNRIIYAGTLLGLVGAGSLLQWLEPVAPGQVSTGGGTGYAVAFLLGAMFRIASAFLLVSTPEPSFAGLARRDQTLRFLGSGRASLAFRLLGLGALFHFTVYLSSPYYGPFMLETLRFTYLEYMAATVLVIVTKAVVIPLIGRAVDKRGARSLWPLALMAIALVPVPWIFANGLLLVLVAQAFSGGSWATFELSYFTLLLEASTRGTRPALFAAQSLVVGWSQLLGSVVAASWLPWMGGDYRNLFLLSAGGRLAVAVLAVFVLRRAPHTTAPTVGRLALRFLGLRPNGGLSPRPVWEKSPGEPPEAEG